MNGTAILASARAALLSSRELPSGAGRNYVYLTFQVTPTNCYATNSRDIPSVGHPIASTPAVEAISRPDIVNVSS